MAMSNSAIKGVSVDFQIEDTTAGGDSLFIFNNCYAPKINVKGVTGYNHLHYILNKTDTEMTKENIDTINYESYGSNVVLI